MVESEADAVGIAELGLSLTADESVFNGRSSTIRLTGIAGTPGIGIGIEGPLLAGGVSGLLGGERGSSGRCPPDRLKSRRTSRINDSMEPSDGPLAPQLHSQLQAGCFP